MTSLTKLMELIEYHSNSILANIINSEPNFDPNSVLRNKHSLVSTAVTYNNFEIFKLLVNHKKYDINANLNWSLDYPSKILKRVSMCDIFENRRYLEELYNLNFKFTGNHLMQIDNETLFIEIFERIEKTYPVLYLIAHRVKSNSNKFKIIFDYIKTNFNNDLTKQQCDGFLKDALSYNYLGIISIIKNNGYDINVCDNRNSILYIIGSFQKDTTLLSYFCSLENIFYKGNLINDLVQFGCLNLNSILYLLKNFEMIKPFYEKIDDTQHNHILKMLVDSISNWNNTTTNYSYIVNDLIDNKVIKLDSSIQIKLDSILKLTQSLKIYNSNRFKQLTKELLIQLMYHGYKPNKDMDEIMKLVFSDQELKNMEETIKNNAKFETKVVKRVVKKIVKKVTKKADDIVL